MFVLKMAELTLVAHNYSLYAIYKCVLNVSPPLDAIPSLLKAKHFLNALESRTTGTLKYPPGPNFFENLLIIRSLVSIKMGILL